MLGSDEVMMLELSIASLCWVLVKGGNGIDRGP